MFFLQCKQVLAAAWRNLMSVVKTLGFLPRVFEPGIRSLPFRSILRLSLELQFLCKSRKLLSESLCVLVEMVSLQLGRVMLFSCKKINCI